MTHRVAALLSALALTAAACSQSDPGITTAVKSKLAADETVKAYQIDVDTADRIVTLSGAVENAAAKEQAVTLARQTDGVRDVVDQITVSAPGAQTAPTTGDDRDLGDRAGDAGRDGLDRARDATVGTQRVATDVSITAAVKGQLLADQTVSGLKIDVDTSNGVVTLSGMAKTRAEADRAATIARETMGVTSVVNNLRVAG
jgi:hyperosmotically inducible periplasmic protein